jgi:hypothetical protein
MNAKMQKQLDAYIKDAEKRAGRKFNANDRLLMVNSFLVGLCMSLEEQVSYLRYENEKLALLDCEDDGPEGEESGNSDGSEGWKRGGSLN